MNEADLPPEPQLLAGLDDRDRARLHETLQRLSNHSAILRDDPGAIEIYEWANLHRTWVREMGTLVGYDVLFEEPYRLILAIPKDAAMMRRLTLEESCIAMVLWHDYDAALREGASVVKMTIKNINDSFVAKLKGVKLPTKAGMKSALQLFHKHRLVRVSATVDFADSTVEILHTLRLVMPFQQLEDWQKQAQFYIKDKDIAATEETSDEP